MYLYGGFCPGGGLSRVYVLIPSLQLDLQHNRQCLHAILLRHMVFIFTPAASRLENESGPPIQKSYFLLGAVPPSNVVCPAFVCPDY